MIKNAPLTSKEQLAMTSTSIIQELKINRYIIDLSYGTVISMSNFLNLDNYRLPEILNQFEENENIIN